MSAIGRRLAAGLDVRFGQRVARVERGQGWTLLIEGGARMQCDALVLAVPAPQALELLAGRSEIAAGLARVEMAPCQAALVAFEHPFDPGFDGAFVSDAPLGWVARHRDKPGRPGSECWTLHATPEWSERHLEAEPGWVAEALLAALEQAPGRSLPAVVHRDAHRWRYALTSRSLGAACAYDPAARVGACGDWCVGGRVEGAWQSGTALAERVLAETPGLAR